MYILWARGSDPLVFPMNYDNVNKTSSHPHNPPHKRQGHSHSPHRTNENEGLVMAQLLRADKLTIPER